MVSVGGVGYAYCNLSFEQTFELTGEEVVPQSIDNIERLAQSIEPKRASAVTVQDLIRYALAHKVKLSEITSFCVPLPGKPTEG